MVSDRGTAFRYATMLSDKLIELSKMEPPTAIAEFGYPIDDPEEVRVFRGFIYNQASATLGLSRSSHGSAMAILNAMRCVTNLKAGGPGTESVYLLNYKLTEEQYREYVNAKSATSRNISPTRYDTLIDEIMRLKTTLKDLEQRVKFLEGNDGR